MAANAEGGPHSFRYRPQAESNSAARDLIDRLTKAGRGADRADAAQRIDAEAQSLRSWAAENGWLITAGEFSEVVGGADQLEGGSEHDVYLDHRAGRVIKLTLPPNFGAGGDLVTYLTNVLVCQGMLGLDWRFEAVLDTETGLRLVTSQAFVVGEKATDDEIRTYFAALGFAQERENTFRRADKVMIADARPDNIFVLPSGTLIPFDVHVRGVGLDSLPSEEDEAEAPLPTAILDTSATAHMPDTLEMPYRAHIIGADWPQALPHTYRLGGMTCLAGDVINDYSFAEPLEIGQKLVFTDMAHYTMVKTTTFNGVPHPDIDTYDPETDELRVVRRFGYEDFKRKLS